MEPGPAAGVNEEVGTPSTQCILDSAKNCGLLVRIILFGRLFPVAVITLRFLAGCLPATRCVATWRWAERAPSQLIRDRAYDYDAMNGTLLELHGVELVSPHKRGRKRPPTQDGRTLRRYAGRWRMERLFWLGNRRRLLVRHKFHLANFAGFRTLGCIMIMLKRILG